MEAGGYEVLPFDLLDLFVDDEELPLDCAGFLEADDGETFLSFDGLFFCSCDAAVADVFTAFLFLSPDASWAFLSSEFSGGAAASTAGWSASCTSGSGLLYPHQLGVFLTDYLVVILYVYALILVPSSHGEPVTVEVA